MTQRDERPKPWDVRTPEPEPNSNLLAQVSAQTSKQQSINLQFVERLGDVTSEIGLLRSEQREGSVALNKGLDSVNKSIITSLKQLGTDQARHADEAKGRASESKEREEKTNENLSDIKTTMSRQTELMEAEAQRKIKRDERKQSYVDRFMNKFFFPMLALIVLAFGIYLGVK